MKWYPVLPALALLLASCDDTEKAKPYTGQSAHWNQQEVPISLQCAACHQKQFEDWAGSDHAWALRSLRKDLDAPAFSGQSITAHGATTTMLLQQGRYLLRDTVDGKTTDWEVAAVCGRAPLVQYLVKGKDKGWQTPSAAWDTGMVNNGMACGTLVSGGVREWFDVFRDDERQVALGGGERHPGEWGHWTGRGMNFNSQCAWCHSTGFHKNYDAATDSYQSSWKEMGVTCIQCHKLADKPDADGCMVQKKDRKLSPKQVTDNCATCHARREELDDRFVVGDRFDDHFRLELPKVQGIFLPNGTQLDEDYCETGFRLSRMGMTGVTCIDCHDPHTGKLLYPQENNELCLRCHAERFKVNGVEPPFVSRDDKFVCPVDSKGHWCVECHMPERGYMGRDRRRDHTLLPPDPISTKETGIPNTCMNCHADKGNDWAIEKVNARYGEPDTHWMNRYRPRWRAMAAAMNGAENAAELLMTAFRKEENPTWRATMLGLMSALPQTEEMRRLAQSSLKSATPLERAAAAEMLGAEAAVNLLEDSSRVVRHTAAWQLFPQILQAPKDSPAARAVKEMEATAKLQSDQPTGAMQLAMLASARGDAAETERQYKRAVEMDASSAVARMDYAVFLARQHRPMEALQQMLACTAANPENAEAQYRLALILAEVGQTAPAVKALQKTLQLQPAHSAAAEMLQQLQALHK